MERSKFNVEKDKEGRTYNGIVFDSRLEMNFYKDIVLPGVESGDIKHYELQKTYILQEGFCKDGRKILPITYVADFYIEYADGHTEVIDTKGMPDSVAKLKRKLFWYIYPDVEYKWMSYVKKWGGWRTYEEIQAARKADKKEKRLKEKNNGKEKQ